MKKTALTALLLAVLAACTPPEVPEDTGPEPVPLSVPLATG